MSQKAVDKLNLLASNHPDIASEIAEVIELLQGKTATATAEPVNYEEKTVPELKELAEKRGIEIPSDARKSDIIEALEKAD